MIVALNREPAELKPFVEVPTTEEERAYNRAADAELRKNLDWFSEHEGEIRDRHSGAFIVVFGQELFFGEDPRDVLSRALAAHPERAKGPYLRNLSSHRLPRIYANRR